MNGSRILGKLIENTKKYPDKIAIAMGDKTYTYSELLKHVQDLSSAIDESYINQPVVIFANREPETILFFLSVAYSGNFYIPLDPAMPIEKIKTIFSETNPAYVFVNHSNKDVFREIPHGKMTLLDIHSSGCFAHRSENVMDSSPLYMVYTSGSTGKPKGVLKTHRAVGSFMQTFSDVFMSDIEEDTVIGNQTPFFFDASAKDIYLALEKGLRMEIIPTELFVIPPRLIAYLNMKKVSFISWVPTALSLVAQMKTFKYVKPEYLKKVFFVGEVMPVKSLNYWIENLDDVSFTNLYGQSEIAGIACYYEVDRKHDESTFLPIGKPLPNCKVRIMENGSVVNKYGSVGEITISSLALAEGYYKDAEKTNQTFVEIEGERWFKTGDYAYQNEDGDLVFMARRDSQIKHLGRRIELGEIEAVTMGFEGIERCCCLYDNMNKRIVLFCQAPDLSEDKIREYLKVHLVSYMQPGKIVMGALPINANGKIDRQLLKGQL